MIVFDLICSQEHTFESWFKDSSAFDKQRKRKLIECPVCGDTKVEKALMAPAVATGRKKDAAREKMVMAQAFKALSDMRKKVEDNCEYVGDKFADEALKIHHGETEKRDIYGEATEDDAERLEEEGVEFGRIPWLPRADN
ncbi:MAG: DUF1178 family protein [Alphaproteobacteria bacterium]